jgi:hypothetical protein
MSAPFLVIPPTLKRLTVTPGLLEESRTLLAGPGEQGLEAAVFWLGRVGSATEARVEAVHFPQQVAYRTEQGLAVEILAEAWTETALRLPPGAFVLAKLHTHGEDAYHSPVDEANPYMRYEGAIAITVPYFARLPFDGFEGWSVNLFREGRWVAVAAADIPRTMVMYEDGL